MSSYLALCRLMFSLLRTQTCRNLTDTVTPFHTDQCLPCKEQHEPLFNLIHMWWVLHSLIILIFQRHTCWTGAHIAPCCGTCLSGERPGDRVLRRAYAPGSLSIPLPILHTTRLAAQTTGSHFSTNIVIAPSALCSFSFSLLWYFNIRIHLDGAGKGGSHVTVESVFYSQWSFLYYLLFPGCWTFAET